TSSQIQYDSSPPPENGLEGENPTGQHSGPGPGFLLARGTPPKTLGALISSSGQVLNAGILTPLTRGNPDDTSKISVTDYATLVAIKSGAGSQTITLTGYGEYQVKAVMVSDGSVLIVGLPLEDINSTQTELTWVFIAVAGGGLLAAGVIGALTIRRTLRP